MTELLCLKTNDGNYVRFSGDSCELTSMSNATVCTMTQKTYIAAQLDKLRSTGMDVYCVKLTITEEPFEL